MSQTCGQCQHFHKLPRNPDMSIPQMGECREQLRAALVQSPNGPMWIVGYPSVPDGFAACGRFSLPLVKLRNGAIAQG